MLPTSSLNCPLLRRVRHNWDMVRPMIIKQGEFAAFAPAELRRHPAAPHPIRPEAGTAPPRRGATPTLRAEILQEVERLVRENERLTLERDQLREEISRQSLQARRAKLSRPRTEKSLKQKGITAGKPDTAGTKRDQGAEDAGYELARVVVNWFWEDPDEASVRLVHDALAGQGIRTIVREADSEDA